MKFARATAWVRLATPSGVIGYSYDKTGNRLSRSSTVAGISAASYSYDNNDRLNGNTYDNNGNTFTANGVTYTYDFLNRLTSATGGIALVYDGDGNRVQETAGGTTTQYLVDDNNPTGYPQVVEEISGGVVQRTYTYGHALISQTQLSGTPTTRYYGDDGLGSVRLLTDASGTKTDSYDYDAFGNVIASSGTTPNNYRFAGEQPDANLGLYYLRARYYNAGTGRFWNRDSAGVDLENPGELNRYVYTADNPVNAIDPTGLSIYEYRAITEAVAQNAQNVAGELGKQTQRLFAIVAANFLAQRARVLERLAKALYKARHNGQDFVERTPGETRVGLAEFQDANGNIRKIAALNDVGLSTRYNELQQSYNEYYEALREVVSEEYDIIAEGQVTNGPKNAIHQERHLFRWLKDHVAEIQEKTTVVGGVPQTTICGTCNAELTGSKENVASLIAILDEGREIDFAVGAHSAIGTIPFEPIP